MRFLMQLDSAPTASSVPARMRAGDSGRQGDSAIETVTGVYDSVYDPSDAACELVACSRRVPSKDATDGEYENTLRPPLVPEEESVYLNMNPRGFASPSISNPH